MHLFPCNHSNHRRTRALKCSTICICGPRGLLVFPLAFVAVLGARPGRRNVSGKLIPSSRGWQLERDLELGRQGPWRCCKGAQDTYGRCWILQLYELVGGDWNLSLLFHSVGECHPSSSQLTKSYCSEGYCRYCTGWLFGTFFIFPYIGNNHPH